jgi:GNAT superfamily N-acetyltransferase
VLNIRRCTIAELEAAPNFGELLDEYAAESSLAELGAPRPQLETYRSLEAAGAFHPIGAFDGDRLAGFILPIVVVLPHYGVLTATAESFFVPRADRKTGAGDRLRVAAEDLARDLGAKALLLSAPVGGVLAQALPGKGYRHSNDVFVKALA